MADRTYDPALLPMLDPTHLDWARTWTRFLLRDLPDLERNQLPATLGQQPIAGKPKWPEFSRNDVELETALKLDSVKVGDVGYFRPHLTASRLYLGDPQLWKSRAVDGTSESRRDAQEIVTAWMRQGAAIDALIPVPNLPGLVDATPTREEKRWLQAIPIIVSGI